MKFKRQERSSLSVNIEQLIYSYSRVSSIQVAGKAVTMATHNLPLNPPVIFLEEPMRPLRGKK